MPPRPREGERPGRAGEGGALRGKRQVFFLRGYALRRAFRQGATADSIFF